MRAKTGFLLLIAATLLTLSCQRQQPTLPKEPWTDLPRDRWPTILLTSHIQLGSMDFRDKACAFLVDTGTDTLAAACKHLFLAFKNPDFQSIHFAGKLRNWSMYPRNNPEKSVVVDLLLNEDQEEEIIKQYVINRDWLIFSLKRSSPDILPLKPRYEKPSKGERLYLIGWAKEGEQRVYEGIIYQAYDYKFLVDMQDQDVSRFSGAPVIDTNGYLVGIHSGKIGDMSWVNSTKYLQEVLENR